MVTTESILQPISAPAEFPVTWEQPEDERLFWQVERMHWPDPMTPMDFAFMRAAHEGFSWAFNHYGVPLAFSARHINYRWYFSVNPTVSDPTLMPSLMGVGLDNLTATIAQLGRLWNDEWLPEVMEHLDYWEQFDLAGASMPELLDHFNETLARHERVWQIHFLQTFPVYMAMSTFDDLYQDLFGTEDGLVAYRLLQGLDNKTVKLGREFWKLSRRVLASPVLRAAFEATDGVDVLAALSESSEGKAFLTTFNRFLDCWGRRGGQLGVSFVTWREDPSQPIRQLRDYVRQPELDIETEMALLVAAREHALAAARTRITGYPRPVIEQFEALLAAAQQATIISEDHNYYIDFGAIYQVRQVILEFGRRFARAGIILDPQDIFMLTPDELRDTINRLPEIDRTVLVRRRKTELEQFRQIAPPPALGTPPTAPPPDDPLSRTIGKFFGAPMPDPETTDGTLVIHGGSGSPGTACGVARVILSLADAGRLAHGEILVAPTTAPAWTPLFATAAAVVTDTGGVLSHSAVVAREYRIPAVVGAAIATTVIQDGDLIEVDGDMGVVRLVQGS
jgi:phosphohistidine swiveling domain-containing protein